MKTTLNAFHSSGTTYTTTPDPYRAPTYIVLTTHTHGSLCNALGKQNERECMIMIMPYKKLAQATKFHPTLTYPLSSL